MAALAPGEYLEGTVYQVVRERGAGGMGVVYEVEHARLKTRYVAKIIHEQVRGDSSVLARMDREVRVLAEINHPNIVQVHDVGTTRDGMSYFVMEKLEGMDLRTTMKRSGLARTRALQIAVDILDALEHVHQRGIVHRDIKPENIFLARQPSGTITKVLDFGVAHIFDGDSRTARDRLTKTGNYVGTLYYSAPEQMRGEPAIAPNDVYATGILLFELLAGRGPFDDDPGVGLSRCFKVAPRLDALLPNVGAALADAIAAALELEPARRATAATFAARLREVLSTEVTQDNAVQADVDDLLGNMAIHNGRPASVTRAPATPMMAGAPAHLVTAAKSTTLRTATTPPLPPTTPRAQLHATIVSAQPAVLPQADTSPGVYRTVQASHDSPSRKRGVVGDIVAAIGIVSVVVLGGVVANVIVRRARPPQVVEATPILSAVVAVEPPPPTAPIPTVAVAPPSASTASFAGAKPASKPISTPGRAKKDGYATVDDL